MRPAAPPRRQPGNERAMSGSGERLVCVGAFAGAFGVRGEVRLKSFCAEPEAIGGYGPLLSEGGRRFVITAMRPIKGGFAVRVEGIETREAAEALKSVRLYVERARLPEPGEEEYYHADLIGLAVFDTAGREIGRVKAVHDFGAGDLLEIARPGGREALLPFTRAAVPVVDIAGGRVVVEPPEGSLD